MTPLESFQLRLTTRAKALLTGIVAVFVFSILLWEHLNGGVESHHLLHQKNLPAISNWWSGLWLPILTWILITRVEKRLAKQQLQPNSSLKTVLRLFLPGLVLGILIAISFEHGFQPFLDNVLYIILLLSLLIPIYYAEFILGFVLGMTYTFGAILPTAFILVLAVVGMILYRFVRPLLTRLIRMMTSKLHKSPNHEH